MGGTSYSYENRALRSQSMGYQTKSVNDIFEQNKKKAIHKDMNPNGVTLRESRDSEAHPNSVPIIIALDVTGSMGHIPHELVKEGLPKIMSGLIENGIPDPQVMFMAIGDHLSDDAPLQISQFESGDAELDMWLTRVYIEGNGGGNGGESYALAHFFANNYVQTDAWDKRQEKGFLFTVGDERFHKVLQSSALKTIMGVGEYKTLNSQDVINEAKKKWNVFHILPGMQKDGSKTQWREVLGEASLWVDNSDDIADTIKNTVLKFPKQKTNAQREEQVEKNEAIVETKKQNIIL